ncbi:MAG: hypothetical protein ACK4SY_09250 [Pyrobaculum sp.]
MQDFDGNLPPPGGIWLPQAAIGRQWESSRGPKPPGRAIVTSQWRYRRRRVDKIHNYVYIFDLRRC